MCPSSVGSARQPREGVKDITREAGDIIGGHSGGSGRSMEKPVSELRLFTPQESKENPERAKVVMMWSDTQLVTLIGYAQDREPETAI